VYANQRCMLYLWLPETVYNFPREVEIVKIIDSFCILVAYSVCTICIPGINTTKVLADYKRVKDKPKPLLVYIQVIMGFRSLEWHYR
jgi:hypothetical protein